jgi:hypothetical protein
MDAEMDADTRSDMKVDTGTCTHTQSPPYDTVSTFLRPQRRYLRTVVV